MTTTGGVLVVCTGNICRSPFVERLLAAQLGSVVPVGSAGTMAMTGYPMEPLAAEQLVLAGGSPDGFRARQITDELILGAALVLCATRAHVSEVLQRQPSAMRRTFALADFAALAKVGPTGGGTLAERITQIASRRGSVILPSGADADLADPYTRGRAAYERMSEDVRRLLPDVVHALGAI